MSSPVLRTMVVRGARSLAPLLASIVLAGTFEAIPAQAATDEVAVVKQVPYLSPEESLTHFSLPAGYRLEPVLTEPIIKEPVTIAFDGNGRMYVAEMRSYMQDVDATDEKAPIGRVSMHWSSKGDGNYDRHSIFADNLVLPRMLLPLADGLVINETDTEDLKVYRDTDGDGVADKVEMFYAGGRRGGNLEHQQSGMIWSLDNWIYQAVNAYRLRIVGTNVVREPTSPNGGQWGISQDNYGKPWFINAGGEVGPLNFQVPIAYLDLDARNQSPADYKTVWPLIGLADFQGGLQRVRQEDQTLNHFTATCGLDFYRGDRLPEDLRGDLLFAEPVGRLIRRSKVEVRDGITHLSNAYTRSEFLRSTDPNFRPVNMFTAPDGTLYIVDMYRGIIQEGTWTLPKSYLRPQILKNGLDKNIGRGRIWRLVHQDFQPGPQPHMLGETPAQLVAHLDHPNGWWRDNAQKLLVLKGDRSVAPTLEQMARTHVNPLARIHSIWTLEGLNALEPALVREKMKDENPQVRIAAMRASETLIKKQNASLVPDVVAMLQDKDPSVVMQAMMTAKLLKFSDATSLIQTTIGANKSEGVLVVGNKLIAPPPVDRGNRGIVNNPQYQRGQAIYKELCFSCHGTDGKGMPLAGGEAGATMAPPFSGSDVVSGVPEGMIKVLLKGLNGPVAGKNYTAQMVAMESNDDAWIAAVVSFVRNSFGNRGRFVSPSEVAAVRATFKERTAPWSTLELAQSLPHVLTNKNDWKVTASANNSAAFLAIDGKTDTRYDTSAPQVPGMYYQIELPQPALIGEIQLDAADSAGDYPRGYKVQTSSDGKTWGEPVATGAGRAAFTDISFTPVTAKFIRITQTGSVDGLYWSIAELQILQPPLVAPDSQKTAKAKANTFE